MKRHGARSASKHRESEYISKRAFSRFLNQLKDQFNDVYKRTEDGYARDIR